MSKQSTLVGFMSKALIGNKNETAPKAKGFKYVKPIERKNNETASSNENSDFNSMLKPSKLLDAKKNTSCIEISDDERIPSPIDNVTTHKKDNSFVDFSEDDLIFTKSSTNEIKSKLTVEDVYAKYGSPETKLNGSSPNKSDDFFDIEKSLSSNPSYVQATKKLSENMLQFDAPKPSSNPSTKSKFKFNVRSSKTSANSTITSTNNNSTVSSFLNASSRTETVVSLPSTNHDSVPKDPWTSKNSTSSSKSTESIAGTVKSLTTKSFTTIEKTDSTMIKARDSTAIKTKDSSDTWSNSTFYSETQPSTSASIPNDKHIISPVDDPM